MSMKLKRNAPYGEIFGGFPEQPTAKYTQDGKLFDAQGNVIMSAEDKAEYKRKLAAELAALEDDGEGVAPAAPPAPTLPPVAAKPPVSEVAEEPAPLTPQQKAAATRAAKKAKEQKADPLGVLPPLED